MNLPLSIELKKLRQDICDLINSSGLPISVIELLMSDIYGEVQAVSRNMYEQDVVNYNKSLKEESGEET